MIGRLKGIVDSLYSDYVILDAGGVGYRLFCSGKTLAGLVAGEAAALWVETHVREDHIHLYGFYGAEEKSTFNLLQSVKGVGTKMALAILSALAPEEISYALAAKDIAVFNQVSGVGKKLAERIITELKDKYSLVNASDSSVAGAVSVGRGLNNIAADAISALVSLGVGRGDARQRVSDILAHDKDTPINELIRQALRNNRLEG